MHILLLDDNERRRDSAIVSLEGKLNSSVHAAASAKDVLQMLSMGAAGESGEIEAFDVLVAQEHLLNEEFTNACEKLGKSIPIVACVDDMPKDTSILESKGVVEFAKNATLIEQLNDVFSTLLSGFDLDGEDAKYCPVRLSLLRKFSPLQVDVYLRLSSLKYIRIFNAGDEFNDEDIEKYEKQKSIKYLYVSRENFEGLFISIENNFERLEHEAIDDNETRDLVQGSVELISDLIDTIGFSQEVISMARKTTHATMKILAKNASIADFIVNFEKNQDQYASGHCLLLCDVINAMAIRLGWATTQNIEKLTLAALFHDITLRSNELAYLQDLDELKLNAYSDAEVALFRSHPDAAASFLDKVDSRNDGLVQTIVAQHHEHPDGTGFPKGLQATQIQALSALFIVAHDLIHEMYKEKENFSLQNFYDSRIDYYAEGPFKAVMRALDVDQIVR